MIRQRLSILLSLVTLGSLVIAVILLILVSPVRCDKMIKLVGNGNIGKTVKPVGATQGKFLKPTRKKTGAKCKNGKTNKCVRMLKMVKAGAATRQIKVNR